MSRLRWYYIINTVGAPRAVPRRAPVHGLVVRAMLERGRGLDRHLRRACGCEKGAGSSVLRRNEGKVGSRGVGGLWRFTPRSAALGGTSCSTWNKSARSGPAAGTVSRCRPPQKVDPSTVAWRPISVWPPAGAERKTACGQKASLVRSGGDAGKATLIRAARPSDIASRRSHDTSTALGLECAGIKRLGRWTPPSTNRRAPLCRWRAAVQTRSTLPLWLTRGRADSWAGVSPARVSFPWRRTRRGPIRHAHQATPLGLAGTVDLLGSIQKKTGRG